MVVNLPLILRARHPRCIPAWGAERGDVAGLNGHAKCERTSGRTWAALRMQCEDGMSTCYHGQHPPELFALLVVVLGARSYHDCEERAVLSGPTTATRSGTCSWQL